MVCRTLGFSDYWSFGLLVFRTNDVPEYWDVPWSAKPWLKHDTLVLKIFYSQGIRPENEESVQKTEPSIFYLQNIEHRLPIMPLAHVFISYLVKVYSCLHNSLLIELQLSIVKLLLMPGKDIEWDKKGIK